MMSPQTVHSSSRAGSQARITVAAPAIAEAAGAFEAYSTAEGLPADVVWRLAVALDEIVANIVAHGASAGAAPTVLDLAFARDADTVEITVSDDGPAFNPLVRAAPDTS